MKLATWIVWTALVTGACDDDAAVDGGAEFKRPTTAKSEGPVVLPDGQTVGGPARHLTVDDGPRFSGLAVVFGGICSGTFVVPAGLDLDAEGPAYVLTAGHCRGHGEPPNKVDANVPFTASDAVRFHHFADSPGAALGVASSQLAFRTMKGVDLALIELADSRRTLRRKGVVPFVLADAPAEDGAEVAFAGYPRSTNLDGFAVLAACHQLKQVPLVLENTWHWYDVEANDCQDAAAGASGAPVLSLSSGRVVAVLNTGVDSRTQPPYPCALNQPCEAGPDVIHFVPNTNYAIPVHDLGACFDATGRFERTRSGCPLDRGVQMQPTVVEGMVRLAAAPGATLTVAVPLDAAGLTYYRTAIGPAATTDCRSATSYGPVTAHAAVPEIAATVPGDAGHYIVCVQAGPGPEPAASDWQDLHTPTMLIVSVE